MIPEQIKLNKLLFDFVNNDNDKYYIDNYDGYTLSELIIIYGKYLFELIYFSDNIDIHKYEKKSIT